MEFSRTCTAPDSPISIEAERLEPKSRWGRPWSKKFGWASKDDTLVPSCSPTPTKEALVDASPIKPSLAKPWARKKVVANLPRNPTFQRQNSEKRERLIAAEPEPTKRRAASIGKKRAMSARPASPQPGAPGKTSAPAVYHIANNGGAPSRSSNHHDHGRNGASNPPAPPPMPAIRPAPPPSPPPEESNGPPEADVPEPPDDGDEEEEIKRELEERWILNLSMHFRDRSPREKFFVTFAEMPTRWRRVTVSCNYRDTPPESLERDLQKLQYQRDKSARIYEAIRLSLRDIQFYETVTNLKLQTSEDDRLHVHVTEDVNEIIPYPSLDMVAHLPERINRSPIAHCVEEYTLRVPESEVHFEAHMSGFVYKVRVDGQLYIKKEIPGPDSVDEFLYEINALYALIGSRHVVQFRGLVIDPAAKVIKGLLIDYAAQGPLVDIIFDADHGLAPARRERWAHQIIHGLSEIHEAGFVQGDFTLSNICIDAADDAVRIIDINRRGCPVGWEPPEIARLIESGQRISMLIGVKSDLFQLGMVLWALMEEEDEPERQPRPLSVETERFAHAPAHLRAMVQSCLASDPKRRRAAKDLLTCFPHGHSHQSAHDANPMPLTNGLLEPPPPPAARSKARGGPSTTRASETEYINPDHAVEREDIESRHGGGGGGGGAPPFARSTLSSDDSRTYVDHHHHPASSSNLHFDDASSYVIPRARGRSPGRDAACRDLGAAASSSSSSAGAAARTRSVGSQTHQSAGFRDVAYERGRGGRSGGGGEGSDGGALSPNVLPISPSHGCRWVEIMRDGRSQIVEKGSLEGIGDAELRGLKGEGIGVGEQEEEEEEEEKEEEGRMAGDGARRARNVVGLAETQDYGFPRYGGEEKRDGSRHAEFDVGHTGGQASSLATEPHAADIPRRSFYPPGRQVLSMEHVDSGLADMDLYGVGGNEGLRLEGNREGVLDGIDEEDKWDKEEEDEDDDEDGGVGGGVGGGRGRGGRGGDVLSGPSGLSVQRA